MRGQASSQSYKAFISRGSSFFLLILFALISLPAFERPVLAQKFRELLAGARESRNSVKALLMRRGLSYRRGMWRESAGLLDIWLSGETVIGIPGLHPSIFVDRAFNRTQRGGEWASMNRTTDEAWKKMMFWTRSTPINQALPSQARLQLMQFPQLYTKGTAIWEPVSGLPVWDYGELYRIRRLYPDYFPASRILGIRTSKEELNQAAKIFVTHVLKHFPRRNPMELGIYRVTDREAGDLGISIFTNDRYTPVFWFRRNPVPIDSADFIDTLVRPSNTLYRWE